MTKQIGLSCCSVFSMPLDYERNKQKIIESIKKCKDLNCNIRIGGELELCGVNCKDSFKELVDMHENCWTMISDILNEKYNNEYLTDNILCFIGMPVYFKQKLYVCEVVIYNNEILMITPKENINNYEDNKYFHPYTKRSDRCNGVSENKNEDKIKFKNSSVTILYHNFEKFSLPQCIQNITKQKETYFGKAIMQMHSLLISQIFLDDLIHVQRSASFDEENAMLIRENTEKLEEIKIPFQKDSINLSVQNGIIFDKIDILLVNGYISNELHLFKKYFVELINLTNKYPNINLCFSNNSGCDNNFYKYDGFSFIAKNKKVLTKNARFSFSEIQVASVSANCSSRNVNIKDLSDVEKDFYSVLKIKRGRFLKEEAEEDASGGENSAEAYPDKCIFSFNEDLDISIKTPYENLVHHLPSNFNWLSYCQSNNPLLRLFNKHYYYSDDSDHGNFYEFNSKKQSLHNTHEELCFNCALFLWHILDLTKAKGFMLAISGGIDSSFVACMVYILSIMIEINLKKKMCTSNKEHVELDDELFFKKIKYLLIDKPCRKDICNKLLNTISLPSRNNNEDTKSFSVLLSNCINSYHTLYNIDSICELYKTVGEEFLNEEMKFKSEGGSNYKDLCMQNIQSRSRMVLTYFFSTLICHKRYFKLNMHNEFLIVLATGNLDESITGYYTKYDCSSGDINLIGNVSKILIKEAMCHVANDPFYDLEILNKINQCHPSAELKPLDNKQTDESELNLPYIEVKLLTILKNVFYLDPHSMFFYLSNYFWVNMPKTFVFDKIQNFFTRVLKHTHKLFILPHSIINEPCGLHLSNFVHYANIDFHKLKKKLNL